MCLYREEILVKLNNFVDLWISWDTRDTGEENKFVMSEGLREEKVFSLGKALISQGMKY